MLSFDFIMYKWFMYNVNENMSWNQITQYWVAHIDREIMTENANQQIAT